MQDTTLRQNDVMAIMDTSLGQIKIKLFEEFAPIACENFIKLSKSGYYDGIIFHRVIADFMIQGGDPTGTGTGGKSIFGKNFKDEFTKELSHIKGALSMANAGRNTNGSQFFIVHAKSTPWLDGNHTIFGFVVEGMDVVDNIANVKVGRNDKPIEDVIINGIQIKKFDNGEIIDY